MHYTKIYPYAGPIVDLGLYRTGESPMIGDVVRMHRDPVGEWARWHLQDMSGTVVAVSDEGISTGSAEVFAARFDLVRRAAASP